MTPQAREIIREVGALRGLNPLAIIGKSRNKRLMFARVEIAKRLVARGYTTTRIGAVLNRDHTTIVFYLERGCKRPSKPKWHPPRISHLRSMKRKPLPENRKHYLTPYAGAYMPDYEWKVRAT
jgi:hypothetical protein